MSSMSGKVTPVRIWPKPRMDLHNCTFQVRGPGWRGIIWYRCEHSLIGWLAIPMKDKPI